MKTLDEVIAYFDNQTQQRHVYLTEDAEDIYNDALHYLKHLQEYYEMSREHHEPNPALTWDELKRMTGRPVWVEYNLHIRNKDFRDKSKRWCIVREFKPWHDIEIIITENGFVLSKNEQVKDWQAYRKERE